jgi:predicted dithiol-disulfide oxidoreductase (DUF899 family)
MTHPSKKVGRLTAGTLDAAPPVVERATWEAQIAALRVREKAHTHEGDAIAAARRRLPMVEVDAKIALTGPHGKLTLLDAFEARQQLIAYHFMWGASQPAAAQCEGCTYYTSQVRELSYLHSRDATYATLCQGPYEESMRYRDFMGWTHPWYSTFGSTEALHVGPGFVLAFYVRQGNRVFETFRTKGRGVEAMSPTYGMLDMTVYGRQEGWEDSPADWPRRWAAGSNAYRTTATGDAAPGHTGRPIAQWPCLEAGHSDDLGG